MRWLLVLLVITFAMPVLAGSIVVGFCDECGYQTDEFFIGGGMTPGYSASVYLDPETGEFYKVGFNIILVVADEIAVNINNNHHEFGELSAEEIAVNITNNHRGIGIDIAEKIAVNITNNHRELGEVTAENVAAVINDIYMETTDTSIYRWEAPVVLGELLLEDRLPAGVFLSDEAAEVSFNWELVSIDSENPCPECGSEAITFERVGFWD